MGAGVIQCQHNAAIYFLIMNKYKWQRYAEDNDKNILTKKRINLGF
jgi:hypothetical protein